MKNFAIFALALFVLGFYYLGYSTDYYVDVNRGGGPSADGSFENPWGTITQALEEVEGSKEDPAVIHVAPGRYDMAHGERFPLVMKSLI